MLRGTHNLSLDTKGRLTIPTRFRDQCPEDAHGIWVCTVDIFEPCLLLYPLAEWELIEKKLRGLSRMDAQERRLQRVLLGHAAECELDGQGRVLLPSTLRQHAGLEKKIMLVGQLNKFEIWDELRWQQQINDDLQALPHEDWASSARLQDFGL